MLRRYQAVIRLTSKDSLAEIAKEDSEAWIREAAQKKLDELHNSLQQEEIKIH